MSDDWDFYLCRVDDAPASIFVDLGIVKEAPLSDRPYMAYVRVHMRVPQENGLSSQEEFEELIRLEDHLKEALAAPSLSYVGRNTSSGCRDFYFYAMDASNWSKQVATALQPFAEYKFDAGSRLDRDWRTYFEFLYPSSEDRRRILNRRVCDELRESGDPLTKKREIDHWAYFVSDADRQGFIDDVKKLGCKIRDRSHSAESKHPFGVQFFRVDLPSYDAIDDVILPLHRAAKEHGGTYDGWETQVLA